MATSQFDFSRKPTSHGRLTNARTGASLQFVLNPASISDKKGSNISADAVPGFSHPKLDWASGKSRVIKFQLKLDAEITQRFKKTNFIAAGTNSGVNPAYLTIRGELDFLRSLELPVYGTDQIVRGPDLVLFSFGLAYSGVLCFFEEAAIQVTEFGTTLEPTRADVDITLQEVVYRSTSAADVWPYGKDKGGR